MRWFWWPTIGLGLLLALWVGAFATLFHLGHRGFVFCHPSRPPIACAVPRSWTYKHTPQFIWERDPTLWRPLMFVWARCWGADRLDIKDFRDDWILRPEEVDRLLHGRY